MAGKRSVGAAGVATIMACLCLAATATAGPIRYCGTIKYRYQGTTYRDNVYVTAGDVSCLGARGADYGYESGAATFPSAGWTCGEEDEGLWEVCTGAGSTVRGVAWAGGASLPKHARNCGIITFQDGASTDRDKVAVLGGSVSCASARTIDRRAEAVPASKVVDIPGWECDFASDDSWVLCVSPTSIVRGVAYAPSATPSRG
ncbi:MAG: hypothetical protein ACLPZR_12230 [Solirubrobacteraceae bacterium]